MTSYYKSEFYKYPIEVENIEGEIIVNIIDTKGRKVIYSWYDLVAKNSESFYISKCLLGGFIQKVPENVLIIGFGSGAFGKYLEDHIKNVKITGIDVDKTMFKISKKELQIKTNDFLIMEGGVAIKKLLNEEKKYDLILIDVYGSDGAIPKSFQDKSLYLNIKKILKNNGTLSVNYSNYHTFNEEKYNNINETIVKVFGKHSLKLVPGKTDRGNVVGVYNLDKKYSSEEIGLKYLEKVKDGQILYDSNMIKNIILN